MGTLGNGRLASMDAAFAEDALSSIHWKAQHIFHMSLVYM